jgi:hypothetical protein
MDATNITSIHFNTATATISTNAARRLARKLGARRCAPARDKDCYFSFPDAESCFAFVRRARRYDVVVNPAESN